MAKRKYTRFTPELSTVAYIDYELKTARFEAMQSGLCFSESYKGCGLILLKNKDLEAGQLVRVKIGELSPLTAEIMWIEKLDRDSIKVGFQFLE